MSSHIRNYAVIAIVAWFLSAGIAGWFGYFSQPDIPPTHLALFLVTPMIGFMGAYVLSAHFRVWTHSIRLSIIVGAHAWRYVGIGFVIAFLLGYLPPQFGIPEGVGDIIAAVFSLPLAFSLHRGKPVRTAFIVWNIFGLVDLLSAITMGILYSQGSFGILRDGVSTALMTMFPIHLIPTFFVPLFILLHILALVRSGEVPRSQSRE